MTSDMRREFKDRDDLITYLKDQFPASATTDDHVSETRGGTDAAQVALDAIEPAKYGKTRNYLDGDVTYLSPYIRHGVLNLSDVRDIAFEKVDHKTDAEKLVTELAWRDYWQRKYEEIGDGIWVEQEAYKTGFDANDYIDELPDDIADGNTGLACVDGFSQQLRETGYLHNHARMYMAAYIVHWRRVKWQAGARWFLTHLLDGDPASNNLSWQWVASTFSHRPYIFNRENLEKYTDGRFCQSCPLAGRCDFEATYDTLREDLFPNKRFDDQLHNGKKKGRKR